MIMRVTSRMCGSGRTSVTRHVHQARRIRPAADAQLPVEVGAPALDPAPAHNRARVVRSQGDGDGGDVCAKNMRHKLYPTRPGSERTGQGTGGDEDLRCKEAGAPVYCWSVPLQGCAPQVGRDALCCC